uniref:Uncharacterized protein n=1 Tax=Oryza glumipatula TaxID=40148 RepID=A0A0D9YP66_9ORYZ
MSPTSARPSQSCPTIPFFSLRRRRPWPRRACRAAAAAEDAMADGRWRRRTIEVSLARRRIPSWVQFARDERKLQSPASRWLYARSRYLKFGNNPKDGTTPVSPVATR